MIFRNNASHAGALETKKSCHPNAQRVTLNAQRVTLKAK
jgi:hypothetical protein